MKAFFIVVAFLLAQANAAQWQAGDILQISRNNMKFNCVIARAAPPAGASMRNEEFSEELVRQLRQGNTLLVARSNLVMRCTLADPKVEARSWYEDEDLGNTLEVSKSDMLFNCKVAAGNVADRDVSPRQYIEVMKNNLLFRCTLQAKEVDREGSLWMEEERMEHDDQVVDERRMIEISQDDLRFKCYLTAHNNANWDLDRNALEVMQGNMLFRCTLAGKKYY